MICNPPLDANGMFDPKAVGSGRVVDMVAVSNSVNRFD
jgi:hypothetical protein